LPSLLGWVVRFFRSRGSNFPKTIIQKCVIHQIRNTIKFLASKDYKPFMADLKKVYRALTLEMAAANFETLDKTWGDQYSIII
jgi:transposase-like protein